MTSALAALTFFAPAVAAYVTAHEGKVTISGPTRMFVEYSGAANLVVVSLFMVSVIAFFVTRSKMKDETERQIVLGAVYGIVWYLGVMFVGAALTAACLPFFALSRS
jgi:hypothetical protein